MSARGWKTVATVVLMLVVVVVPGCAGVQSAEPSGGEATGAGSAAEGPEAVLESFWEATRKAGSYEVVTTTPGQNPYTMQAEFTFDGSRFRIDYEDGPTIMSPDGVKVVYVDHEAKDTQAGQTPAGYYEGLFTKPAAALEDQGVDAATGAEKYYVAVDELYSESDSLSTWYEKDRTYFVKDGTLVRLVTRGNKDASAGEEWIEHVFTFGTVDLNPEIAEETFEVPYQD